MLFSDQHLEVMRPARRRRSVMRLLSGLASLQDQTPDTHSDDSPSRLNDALLETRRIAHTGSRIFVISDFLHADQGTARLLRQIARHNKVTALRVVDRLEQELPPPGRYAVGAGEQTLWLDTGNAAFREAFTDRVATHEAHLAQLFRQAQVAPVTLHTGDELTPLLRRLPR